MSDNEAPFCEPTAEGPLKVNKAKILQALKADLRAAERLKESIDAKIKSWRDAYEGAPYGNETKGRSAVISRDIKRQSSWQHPSLVDPFVNNHDLVRCLPITPEDREAATQNELLLNTQFCRKFDRFNFMSKAIMVLDQEGTLVVQTGWEYEDREEEREVEVVGVNEFGEEIVITQIESVTIPVKNQPTARICRNEDVYIDPTCQDDINKAQFFIYRYETDLSSLKKDGRYTNLERIGKGGSDYEGDYRSPDTTVFKFEDAPRKKLLVYEYWGNFDIDGDGIAEPIVCAWVQNTIIRLEDNPYPDGKAPFLVVALNPTPFKIHGEATAELIGDMQKVKTAILRGILDNMMLSNNGQIGIQKNVLDPVNRTRFLQGKSFEFNGSLNGFWQGSYNPIPGSVFDVLSLMNNEIESLSGGKGFSQGLTGASLGGSATAARGVLDSTAVRRMHVVRNIAENLVKPLMRKWMAYNAVFLEEEEVVRTTNNQYIPIRKDNLTGEIDIDIVVTTAEDNAAKAQDLSFLLQTIAPNEDAGVRQLLIANFLDLLRMPDYAKQIKEYSPEPDPVEQQLKELELARLQKENALLDARIAFEQARTRDYDANVELLASKTQTEVSKARKLDSEADNLDLHFLRTDDDIDEKYKQASEERKRLHQLDLAAFQATHGDKNIGVVR